ncbi:hypothetical protein BDU57DRAFT_556238 [Ampelomyces quisqualis]|uniref:BTB domain-containing protein n=1 Tax=Ampelomyces quisqualis TaxID=50730 RepID=A0A6A5QKH6_AMPQU|nr:hypothetical protein BDU57DRAFT_556238 [Ampelomyces quisqualis]
MSFGGNRHQRTCPPALLKSYKDEEFTDLTISCGSLIFNVHAVVVCSACDFFKRSLKFAVGKESKERGIDLPEDDPEMIRRLIAYLYLGDYDPTIGCDVARFESIKRYDSTSAPNATYHPREGAFDVSLDNPCSCFAQNTLQIVQARAETVATGPHEDLKTFQKGASLIEVANPLTIHATMYALGDKYQVEGLCYVATQKFESCLPHHAYSEDFVSAVQIAYSSTPDSNRGLRDSVLAAFHTHFQTDISQIPGAEAKLNSIDELSFLLITSWPVKVQQAKAVETSGAVSKFAVGDAQAATRIPPETSDPAPPPYEVPNPALSPRSCTKDEERSCGLWSEKESSSSGGYTGLRLTTVARDHHGFYAFCCFWCAVLVCILGAFGVFFTLDIVFSTFGMGTGIAGWMMQREGYDMHFCLASPNRAAPGPQTWRYIRPDDIPNCGTEVVTLAAKATEHWKLHLDDENMFGDDVLRRTVSERDDAEELSAEEKIDTVDMGDDVATEGEDELWGLKKWEEGSR